MFDLTICSFIEFFFKILLFIYLFIYYDSYNMKH